MTHHYELTEWTDYVRGLVDHDRGAEMAAHLAGCAACRELAAWQARVATVAGRDRGFEPPAWIVERAVAIYPPRRESPFAGLPHWLATLTSGDWLVPLPAGVRGTAVARSGTFEAAGYSIEIRAERDDRSRQTQLVGQIAATAPRTTVASLDIVLVDDQRVVAQTTSNEFGEFEFACGMRRSMALQIPVDGATRRVDVPLRALLSDGVEGGEESVE